MPRPTSTPVGLLNRRPPILDPDLVTVLVPVSGYPTLSQLQFPTIAAGAHRRPPLPGPQFRRSSIAFTPLVVRPLSGVVPAPTAILAPVFVGCSAVVLPPTIISTPVVVSISVVVPISFRVAAVLGISTGRGRPRVGVRRSIGVPAFGVPILGRLRILGIPVVGVALLGVPVVGMVVVGVSGSPAPGAPTCVTLLRPLPPPLRRRRVSSRPSGFRPGRLRITVVQIGWPRESARVHICGASDLDCLGVPIDTARDRPGHLRWLRPVPR